MPPPVRRADLLGRSDERPQPSAEEPEINSAWQQCRNRASPGKLLAGSPVRAAIFLKAWISRRNLFDMTAQLNCPRLLRYLFFNMPLTLTFLRHRQTCWKH
jgi:hypothetical protein